MGVCEHTIITGKRKGLPCGYSTALGNRCYRHRDMTIKDRCVPLVMKQKNEIKAKGKPKIHSTEIKQAENDFEYPLQPIETITTNKNQYFKKISNMNLNQK